MTNADYFAIGLLIILALWGVARLLRRTCAYGSNCNVKLTALHRLKPSSNAKSHEGSIRSCAPLRSQWDNRALTSAQDEVR